jgi:lipid II:glycine glycyltransferase (peptidoglycan interpeptide bridge formation enzyme)
VSTSKYISEIDRVSREEWNALLPSFHDASVYQTWEYGAVCWGEKQISHLVLKSNNAIVAMAQVRIVRVPVIGSGVAYVRWGPLWRTNDGADAEVFAAAMRELHREYVEKRGLVLRTIPNVYSDDAFADSARAVLEENRFSLAQEVAPYRTFRVDLSPSIEDLRGGLHQRWRNKLKNGEKSGFNIVIGKSAELYRQFAVAYEEMMARKKFETTVDIYEFEKIQASLPEALKMTVLVCEKDGQVFNSLVVATGGDTGIYLLAATSNAGLQANGAFVLQWKAIELLKERGFRWYDLGGANPEKNPGGYQFKSGIRGHETTQLGRFDCDGNWFSRLSVLSGERLQQEKVRLQKLLQRADKDEGAKRIPATTPAA